MFFLQISLVLYGIIILVTPQISPEGKHHQKIEEKKQIGKNDVELQPPNTNSKSVPVINFPSSKIKDEKNKGSNGISPNNLNNSSSANVTMNQISSNSSYNGLPKNPKIDKTFEEKTDEVTSGAITRGILVFVTLAFLFILYVGIKTYRRKNLGKKCTMVRKYGVRARRTDVEMEPLPLSDDEEDETVFDLTTSRGSNR